jgi:hypothetical protein
LGRVPRNFYAYELATSNADHPNIFHDASGHHTAGKVEANTLADFESGLLHLEAPLLAALLREFLEDPLLLLVREVVQEEILLPLFAGAVVRNRVGR